MTKTYIDGSDVEYEHPRDAVEAWSTGCMDDGCCRHNLCEYCDEEVAKARRAVGEWHSDREVVWASAQFRFVAMAVEMGYDEGELYELTTGNWEHGAYRAEHGACSETIMHNYDEDTDTLSMSDDEIENIISSMGGASMRHESTGYDEMLASGISRENARECIR